MTLILDAGALIGIDRGDRRVAGLLELGQRTGSALVTSVAVVGQVWRDGGRQVLLARALPAIEARDVALADARRAGELIGKAGTADVVDALIALLVRPTDTVLTSDPDDLARLLTARDVKATIVRV